jgi:hypothetical protein
MPERRGAHVPTALIRWGTPITAILAELPRSAGDRSAESRVSPIDSLFCHRGGRRSQSFVGES